MPKCVAICFLWIFLTEVYGEQTHQLTNNNGFKLPETRNQGNDESENLLTELLKMSLSRKKTLEELKRYRSEKESQIIKPEVQLADDMKTLEALENVLVKRLLFGRKMNSALDEWLIAKMKALSITGNEIGNRGWGNKGIPPKSG